MVGSISAQIALLAFAAAVFAGLYAGNSAATVLLRALVAMLVALLVGKLAGWTTKLVLRDYSQRKKLAIDQSHSATTGPVKPEGLSEKTEGVETG
jgi:hypothetical protein